jgi:hypothetical protein
MQKIKNSTTGNGKAFINKDLDKQIRFNERDGNAVNHITADQKDRGLCGQVKALAIIGLLIFCSIFKLSGQTVLIDPAGAGGFESGSTMTSNGWTVVNGSNANYWVEGTATKYAGTYSAFISNDGTTNTYNTNRTSTVHFYRDITVPSGEEDIVLSFYLNGQVENYYGTIYDRFLVYTAPTTVTPVAGNPVSSSTTLTGATLIYSQPAAISSYTYQEIELPASLAGTTFRLIFTWQNDNSAGTNPPASIDNISLTSSVNHPDRYAVANGNWSSTGTWSYTSGGAAGASVPGVNDNVYIEGGHSVTLDRNTPVLTLLDITSGSTLITTGAYTVSATTLTVDGTYNNGSTGAITATTMSVNDGGTYQHNINEGDIPTATWATTSTCLVTGVTNTIPTNITFTQAFGNFTWNCTNQNSDISFAANLATVNGNMNIVSTGSGSLRLMNGGGTGTYTCTVAGNFTQTGGSFFVLGDYTSSGSMELYVTGGLVISSGTFNVDGSSRPQSTGALYAAGDVTLASGTTFTETGSGTANVYFNGTSKQTFTSAATMSGTINFTVNSGAYLQMGTGATPSYINGSTGAFTLSSGATLGVTSVAGITTTGATGNIQITGTRTYTTGANYIYNGTAAQVTGNGLTQNTPAAITINNSAGVTLSAVTTASGLLTMASGTLNMANTNLTIGSLTGSGNITNSSGTPGARTIFVGSDNTSADPFSGIISNGTATTVALTKTGTGTLTLANAANTYTGVTTISAGTILLNPVSATATFASQVVLPGGTLGTTGIVTGTTITSSKTLKLSASSTITLGSNSHELHFANTSGETWTGTLTIANWGSTGGKVFFGTSTAGLTTTQLGNITFDGYSAGASIESTGEVKPAHMSTVTIASSSPAASAANVNQGSTNNIVYSFTVAATGYNAVVAGLQIPTGGTYIQGDIDNLKVWYSSDATFSSSSDVLLSTLAYPTAAGTLVFSDWTNQSVAAGATGYFFVTADIACSGTAGATFNVGAIATSDISVYATKSGTASAGGTQTIVYVEPAAMTTASASSGDRQSVLTWSAPETCYDEVMIVAKANSAVPITPIPSGTSYTASLVYGSGTSFGGGYVVYRGTSSSQTVTGLTNGITYYFTFFARKGTTWTTGLIRSATMIAPVAGDYKTAASGNWETLSTWLYYDGSSWSTPNFMQGVPDNRSNKITILSGHTVTIAANGTRRADQLTIDAGGQLSISNISTLEVDNSTDAIDMTVNGTLYNTGAVSLNSNPTIYFGSGGVYQHARNGGPIPAATWDATSTCYVTGTTTSVPTITSGQSFGNFTWNCANQSGNLSLAGLVSTVNGNFTISAINAGSLSLGNTETTNLTIAGDFLLSSGYFYVSGTTTSAAARSMTVGGDFNMTGGTLNLSSTGAAGNTATIYVAGNFTHKGGLITETGSSTLSSITFNGTGNEQLYTSGGTVSYTVNFNINNPAYVQMGTGASPSTITGAGTFTIASGATLGVTSPLGIATAGTISGNILSTGRVYTAGANYIYNGTANQITGLGLAASVAGNLTIDNNGGSGSNVVSLTATKAISGNLTVTNGIFDLGANTCDRSASGGTLTLAGGTTLRIAGTNTSLPTFATNTLDATSTTEYYGTTQTVAAIASPGYGHLIITTAGIKTATGSIYVQGNTTLNTGTTFAGSTYTHYLSGNWTNNGGTFTGGSSTVTFSGTDQTIGGTFSTTFNNLTISSTSSATLGLNTAVSGDLNVTSGTFDLGGYTCNRASSGGTLTVASGATLKIGSTNTMPSNYSTHTLGITSTVWYSGAAQTVCPETASGYGNLTLSGTGTKTIASGAAVTVNTALTTGNLLTIQSSSLSSSGSLIVKGTSSGTLTYNRQLLTEAGYGDYQYISSPVASNTATNSSYITAVYGWNEITGTWPTTTMTALVSGRGYNLDQTTSSTGLISFTGTVATSASIPVTSPYSDVITGAESNYNSRSFIGTGGHSGVARSLSNYGGGGWNLLGNPFTSAMLVTSFISANTSSFDPNYLAVYIYNPTIGTKGTYYYIGNSTGWGSGTSQTHVQAGQGFFVMAMNDNSTFTFSNSMQEHATTDAIYKSTKSEERWPGLQLKAEYGNDESFTTVVFNSEMKKDVDPGYDIGLMSTHPEIDIYTVLPEDNGINYMQQALPSTDIDSLVVPVGVDCEAGGEVTFSAETVPLDNYSYILEDMTTGKLTDLSTDKYTTTIPAGTSGIGRFYLRTKGSGTTDITPEPEDPDLLNVRIWSHDNVIYVKGSVSGKAMAIVFDMQGHMIYDNFLVEGTYNTVPITNATNGIYIVKITDGTKVIIKKVMLN